MGKRVTSSAFVSLVFIGFTSISNWRMSPIGYLYSLKCLLLATIITPECLLVATIITYVSKASFALPKKILDIPCYTAPLVVVQMAHRPRIWTSNNHPSYQGRTHCWVSSLLYYRWLQEKSELGTLVTPEYLLLATLNAPECPLLATFIAPNKQSGLM